MMSSTAFIAGVIVIEAWPVYALLQAQMQGTGIGTREIVSAVVGLGAAVLVSGVLAAVSLRVAVRRIEAVEL
jgi:hypothetical protein